MTKHNTVSNSYLRLLSQDLNLLEVLSNIDIESIEDHHTKVICRTIKGSVEALFEYLNSDTEDHFSDAAPSQDDINKFS